MGKSGMHQPIVNNPVAELPIDLAELVTTMSGVSPVLSMPHSRGIGKKCFIQAESKSNGFVIEFFTEMVVPDTPSDPSVGYRSDDIRQFRGVLLTHYNQDEVRDGYYLNQGEIVPYDEFVERYVNTSEMRVRLDRIMERMEEGIQVSDGFLDSANSVWENRDPGSKSLDFSVLH